MAEKTPDAIIKVWGNFAHIDVNLKRGWEPNGKIDPIGAGLPETIHRNIDTKWQTWKTGGVWMPLSKIIDILSPGNKQYIPIRDEYVEGVVLVGHKVDYVLHRQPAGEYKLHLLDKVVTTWLPPLLWAKLPLGLYCGFDLDGDQENPMTLYNFPFNCAGSGEICMGNVKVGKKLNIPLHLYASKPNMDYTIRLKGGNVKKWLDLLAKKDIKGLKDHMISFTWDHTK